MWSLGLRTVNSVCHLRKESGIRLSPKSNYNLNINGYEAFHLYGNKSPNVRKGRYSGGISVCYKLELKNKLQIEEKQQSGIIWLKLCKSLFNLTPMCFCATYAFHHVNLDW